MVVVPVVLENGMKHAYFIGKTRLKKALDKAIKNMRPLSGEEITAIRNMDSADKNFKPNKRRHDD